MKKNSKVPSGTSIIIMLFLLFQIFLFTPDLLCDDDLDMLARAETRESLEFEMDTEFEIGMVTIMNYTGADAKSYRKNIDNQYGNGDGMVNETEVAGYKKYLTDNVEGIDYTVNTYLDGFSLMVRTTTVRLSGMTGPVNSTRPLELGFDSRMEDPQKAQGAIWHTIVFLGKNYKNYNITLIAPVGWQVAQDPTNLEVQYQSDDGREIVGSVVGDFDVKIKIYNPSRMDDESGSAGTGELGDLIYSNLILILPLLVAAVIIVYFILKRRKWGDE